MAQKIGRNKPCPCGSGLKYKYCCISRVPRKRIIKSKETCKECGGPTEVDLTNDLMNLMSMPFIKLHNYFKDQDLYFFQSCLTLADVIEIEKRIHEGTIDKKYLVDLYISKLKKSETLLYLEDAAKYHSAFKSRLNILKDAVQAHFQKKYTLSIPVLFAQIEGVLREYGELKQSENFKPTIPVESWNTRLLFTQTDSAQYFNAFISKLFQGQQDVSSLNRNTILHGLNMEYASEEWSAILVLVLLEIRNFIWFENHSQELIK